MKKIFLFTMKGCPHCLDLKEMLYDEDIDFVEKDIDENDSEYEEFKSIVDGNEYVPAFLCVKIDQNKIEDYAALVPERDFQELSEAVEMVKNFLTKD